MVAELFGVAIGGAVLLLAVDLVDGRVDVDDEASVARSRPERPGGPSASPMTRSNWRTWPKVNERKKVPSVEGAITRCSSTSAVAPARSMSAWSMVAGPGHHGVHQRQDLAPRPEATDASAQLDRGVTEPLEPKPFGHGGNEHQAGIGHQVGLVEGHRDAVDPARYWLHRKCLLCGRELRRQIPQFSQQRGHFPRMRGVRSHGYSVYRGLDSEGSLSSVRRMFRIGPLFSSTPSGSRGATT